MGPGECTAHTYTCTEGKLSEEPCPLLTCGGICLEQEVQEAVGKEWIHDHLQLWTTLGTHKLRETEEGKEERKEGGREGGRKGGRLGEC